MTVVAIVPAKDRADRVGATVEALRRLERVDRVLVVDDGSMDRTAEVAVAAGADVLVLPQNVGKAGAVSAGVAAAPDADVYLLIDADLSDTAAAADRLLDPVLSGSADLTVGVLPPAAGRGGFGTIKRFARWGVLRGSGLTHQAPLSGQRAVRADLLRGMGPASRFGLEVAMTIDVARAGGRVVEVEVPMDHRHTGRTLAGFRHRGRQGVDILRALWPRIVGARARTALAVMLALATIVAMLAVSGRRFPSSDAPVSDARRVVLIGLPHWSLDDLGTGTMPETDRLIAEGAMAAMSARTASGRPASVEAYASIGAGTRIRGGGSLSAAYDRSTRIEGGTAAEVTARRTGITPAGEVVIPSIGAAKESAGRNVSSEPGALGDALHAAGLTTAVIGTADRIDVDGRFARDRPVAAAVVDSAGVVDFGTVSGSRLLTKDPTAPYGIESDADVVLAELQTALDAGASVIAIDPGDTDRAVTYGTVVSEERAEELRVESLARSDRLVGRIVDAVGQDALVIVAGVVPPTSTWELTPVLLHGAGVEPGRLHSTSTKRSDLVTITDLTPTILDALGIDTPDGMIGAPLRFRDGQADIGAVKEQNEVAVSREGIYYPIALTFIIVQALAYLCLMVLFSQGGPGSRAANVVRVIVLTFAAWPIGTFVLRAVPVTYSWGAGAHALLWVVAAAAALVASRARSHPLRPLTWITGTTVAIMVVDVATGGTLQMSSILGYSPHTAARFTGFGNTAFAVLAATAIVTAAAHVQYAPRRRDALVTAGALFAVVLVADAAPTLGSDVGGILTLVPVFGLVAYAMAGRRVSARVVITAGLVTVLVVAAVAALDIARGPGARTHLGDFAAGMFDGDGTFWTTISRKWATNLRVFRQSIWTWLVPIISVFGVYVLVYGRGWRRLLPPGSPIRAGVIGTLAAGIVGWLVNDSGVVVTALIFVYVGPYLTLLRLQPDRPVRLQLSDGTVEEIEGLTIGSRP